MTIVSFWGARGEQKSCIKCSILDSAGTVSTSQKIKLIKNKESYEFYDISAIYITLKIQSMADLSTKIYNFLNESGMFLSYFVIRTFKLLDPYLHVQYFSKQKILLN